MLRKLTSAKVTFEPGWLTGVGWVSLHINKSTSYRIVKLSKDQFQAKLRQQQIEPMLLVRTDSHAYWQFHDAIYADTDQLTESEVYALITARTQVKKRRVERAVDMVAQDAAARSVAPRQRIPDDVKAHVWQRDRGRCQRCGSDSELQFDHVIPLAMGGATSVQNLQILCGPCNRVKGARISAG